MSSSYTTSLQIQKIGNGEQSGIWGSTTNTNWDLIEQAVAGVRTITMSNSNYTLTALNGLSDEARNMVLIVQGTNNTTYQVIAPLVSKMYVVTNNTSGGNAITIGASTGSVITIPNGTTAQVYCDGSTGFFSAQTGSAGNFTVNGNLTVTGNQADVGSFSAASISVSGAAAFATSPTAPTPTVGDNSTKLATTAFVQSATSGLGTMATQNASAVAITGGSINSVTGTAIGLTVGSASTATSLSTTLGVAYGGTGLTSVGTSGYPLVSNGSGLVFKKLGLGITGETWHDVSGSRSAGTTYTNSYSYPIQVTVSASILGSYVLFYVNGSGVIITNAGPVYGTAGAISVIIPPGATYSLSSAANIWLELY